MSNAKNRQLGTVTRLVPNRGFGFARGEVDHVAYFFHASEVDNFDALNARCVSRNYREQQDGSLVLGDVARAALVTFAPAPPERAAKGPRAEALELIST